MTHLVCGKMEDGCLFLEKLRIRRVEVWICECGCRDRAQYAYRSNHFIKYKQVCDVVRIEDGVRLGGELAVKRKRLSPTGVGDDACSQDGTFWVDDCSEKEGTSHSVAVVENGNDVRVGSHIVWDALPGEGAICLRSVVRERPLGRHLPNGLSNQDNVWQENKCLNTYGAKL